MDVGDIFFCRQPSNLGTVPPGMPKDFYGVIEDLPRPYDGRHHLVRTSVVGFKYGNIFKLRSWNLIAEDLEILDL